MVRHSTFLLTLAAVGCGQTGTPTLEIFGPGFVLRDGTTVTMRVVGTSADGKVGAGKVLVEADVGTIDPTTLTLDEFGTATFTYSCDATSIQDCAIARATLTGRWLLKPVVTTEVTLSLRDKMMTGGGAGGGTGGGLPMGCPAASYNNSTFCAPGQTPGSNVACCRVTGSIPACTDTFVCDGQTVTVPYTRRPVMADGGLGAGTNVSIGLVWTIPYQRSTTLAECQALNVGYQMNVAGMLSKGRNLVSYGFIDPTGEYFAIRTNSPVETLHPAADDECARVIVDGGTNGIWNSLAPGSITTVENGSRYVYNPTDPAPQFFFITHFR